MRIIDLSHTVETLPPEIPAFLCVEMTDSDHAAGATAMEQGFGVPPRLLCNGEGPAGERLSIGTHAATHVDAPYPGIRVRAVEMIRRDRKWIAAQIGRAEARRASGW